MILPNYKNPLLNTACSNCGNTFAYRSSTEWENGYYCCSDDCGTQLRNKLENLMKSSKVSKRIKKIEQLIQEIYDFEMQILSDKSVDHSRSRGYCLRNL